jgi:hypothetical protein
MLALLSPDAAVAVLSLDTAAELSIGIVCELSTIDIACELSPDGGVIPLS